MLALALFVISAIILGRNWFGPALVLDTGAPLALGIVGLVSTVVAGALGWTLVQTHHVGVKPTEHHMARPPQEIDDLDELIMPPATTEEPAYPMHH